MRLKGGRQKIKKVWSLRNQEKKAYKGEGSDHLCQILLLDQGLGIDYQIK